MSEHESLAAQWGPPKAEAQPLDGEALIRKQYEQELSDDAESDDMKMLVGSERGAPLIFSEIADHITENANEGNQGEVYQRILAYGNDLLSQADAGTLTNGKEGDAYRVVTRDQIMASFADLGSDEQTFAGFTRANGLRSSIVALATGEMTDKATKAAVQEIIYQEGLRKAEIANKRRESEAARRALSVGAIGASGLIEVPAAFLVRNQTEATVPEVEAQASREAEPTLEDKIRDLSPQDQDELRSYASAHESMVAARQDGEGENAQYFQQQKGQAQRALSPAAYLLKEQYLRRFMASS